MKVAGFLLIIFQIMALFSVVASSLATGVNMFPSSFPSLVGFFSFAIVGIILLIKSNKQSEEDTDDPGEE